MSYTKLAHSVLTSSIWAEDAETRLVWIAILAMKDKNGEVSSTIPGLANLARVSIAGCEAAIAKFLAPDKYSRSKEFDGRRLEEIDGGWFVLNHEKYCILDGEADRRRKDAIRQQRKRERDRSRDKSRDTPPSGVTNHASPPHVDVDVDNSLSKADGDREAERKKREREIGASLETATATTTAVTVRESSPDEELLQCHASSQSATDVTCGPDSSETPLSPLKPDSGATLTPESTKACGPTSLSSTMCPGLPKQFSDADVDLIFWAYPRHVEKLNACAAIRKALETTDYHLLLERTQQFAASPAGQKNQYTPYPAKWFLAGGYLTDPKEWSAGTAPAKPVDPRRAPMPPGLSPESPRDTAPYAVRKAREWKCSIRDYFNAIKQPDRITQFAADHPEYNLDEK